MKENKRRKLKIGVAKVIGVRLQKTKAKNNIYDNDCGDDVDHSP